MYIPATDALERGAVDKELGCQVPRVRWSRSKPSINGARVEKKLEYASIEVLIRSFARGMAEPWRKELEIDVFANEKKRNQCCGWAKGVNAPECDVLEDGVGYERQVVDAAHVVVRDDGERGLGFLSH